jgi:hypothetical protein
VTLNPAAWTAGDLVAAGRCSPQCLLAFNGKCDCPCNGRWHGALTTAELGEARVPWHERHCGYTQPILDQLCPPIRSGVTDFNRHYRNATRDHSVFAVAQRCGKAWETHVDVGTACSIKGQRWDYLPEDSVSLWQDVICALMLARRLRGGSVGREMADAYGVQTQTEAQVLGALAVELHAGNPDGARSCLAALDEDGYVRPVRRVTV